MSTPVNGAQGLSTASGYLMRPWHATPEPPPELPGPEVEAVSISISRLVSTLKWFQGPQGHPRSSTLVIICMSMPYPTSK